MSIPRMLAVVAVSGLLSSSCAVKKVASKVLEPFKRATVELYCTPKVAIGSRFGPVTVVATVRVKNPGEKYWCPGVKWYVDETMISGHESDCEPYETVVAKEGREPEAWSEPAKFFPLFEGEHTITAKLTRAGRVIASKHCAVTVR